MSAERRHQDRRRRLIDAAVVLMGTRGVAATTVTAVCAESRVTSRYFYQHFHDRDALLRAVHERLHGAMQNVIIDAIPVTGGPPVALAQAPIDALVNMIERDPKLARIVFIEAATEPILRQLRSELISDFADLVLREARRYLDIPDSAVRVTHLASTLGVAGLFEVLRRWLDGEIDYSRDELVTHCAGIFGSLGTYVLQTNPPSSNQNL